MTEGVDPGKTINRLASYLDRLIDFFFSLPLPVSIINLVPSDKSSRSLRLSTFLIRFAGGDSPTSIVFRNQLDYFHPSLPSDIYILEAMVEISRFSYLISGLIKGKWLKCMYNENYKMTFYNNRFIVFSMDIFLRFGGTCSVCLFRDFKKKEALNYCTSVKKIVS